MANNIDLEQIPGQIGTAIVHIGDGSIEKCSGELMGENGQDVINSLYRILLDTGRVLDDNEPLHKITVSSNSSDYVLTVSGELIFIVKKEHL